jgi:hypothetical protein
VRSDVQRLQTLVKHFDNDEDAAKILADLKRSDPEFKSTGICWEPEFRGRVEKFLNSGGRGAAAVSQPVTSVVPKADHDKFGQLHDASNYGLICAVPGEPGKFVARDHVPIKGLTEIKNIEALGVQRTVIEAVKAAQTKGHKFWWGGDDPSTALVNNLAKELEALRQSLLGLIPKAPEKVLKNAKTKEGREKAGVKWAIEQYIAQSPGRRRYTRVQIMSLRILKGPSEVGGRPKRVTPEGKNDRFLYYINADGDRDIEVVSKLDANSASFKEAWRDGGRLLFAMRKNDIIELLSDPKDTSSRRSLYRLASSSDKGAIDIEFTPLEDARSPRELPKLAQVRVRSVGAFNERMPEMVLCDATGRLRWKGPKMN